MSIIQDYRQKPPQGFIFPSWDRVLVYLCALFVVCWSVGPFLWQMSSSIQLDRELMSAKPTLNTQSDNIRPFCQYFRRQEFSPLHHQFCNCYRYDDFPLFTLRLRRGVRACAPRYPWPVRNPWLHSGGFNVPADCDRCSTLHVGF